MQERNKITAILLLVIFAIFSCDDVLEEDITDDVIQITNPLNGSVIVGNTVGFSWQAVDGADNYRIQILENSQTTILDSLISSTTFNYVLNEGSYQWRVKGENFAYQTAYSFPASFDVEVSEDLTTQTVVLQTPSANLYTNTNTFIFTWDNLPSANSYTIEILKNISGLQTVFQESGITNNTITVDATVFSDDAEYVWRVKAVNATSQTNTVERAFFIDRVTPNQPTLVTPLDFETATIGTVTFNWLNGTDSGNVQSQITNTFEIASDLNFNTTIYSTSTTNNSSQFEFTAIGTYYWRVKATDLATNSSEYSIVRTIEIQ
ncbi:hypothetical protein [uncultured Lacinutrix sp.]|uniref:hypothetical protein n=1 Tax=uncultured Lacinutrix sp. TaxID=574032 RepID=UPI00262DCA16|nr:hypothetical protein [uncultured Lacinutrix sp.]